MPIRAACAFRTDGAAAVQQTALAAPTADAQAGRQTRGPMHPLHIALILCCCLSAQEAPPMPPAAPPPGACFVAANLPFYGLIFPHAEHRDGKTFIAFQHTSMDPYVMAYDHAADRWSPAVQAGISGTLDDDSHGNPALWLDREGRIHLIYGCHGGFNGDQAYHARSLRPLDVTAWEQLPPITKKLTYPQISRLSGGRLLLFYRAGVHRIDKQRHDPWGYRISADGGNTWGDFTPVTNGRGDLYCRALVGPDDAVHVNVVWESPPAIGRQDAFYVRLDLTARTAVNSAGAAVPWPFGMPELHATCLVQRTGDGDTTINPGAAVAADGTYWMATHSSADGNVRALVLPPGGSFRSAPVTDGIANWASDALIELIDPQSAWLYTTRNGQPTGTMGGEIHRYRTDDGGASWRHDRRITDSRTTGAITLVHNAHPDARILFCDRASNAVFLWGERGCVGAAGIGSQPDR